jgi:hypothetical protein
LATSDGSVGSTTKIVDHGAASARWNLVILGDGYRLSELPGYRAQAQRVADKLKVTEPFPQLWSAINVWCVDVISTDSGADDPEACGGTGALARTYFDATFCGDGTIRRLLTVDIGTALSVARSAVPESQFAMVLVNSSIFGGSGGAVATVSNHAAAMEVALHEMGHTAFDLADEYEFWAGCGSGEKGHDKYVGGRPAEANLDKEADAVAIKWKTLVTPGAALPTTANPNCAWCDPQASPVRDGTVGAFEGAGYYHCGLYRAEFSCRMRALGQPFCAVCQLAIQTRIRPYLPPKKTRSKRPTTSKRRPKPSRRLDDE